MTHQAIRISLILWQRLLKSLNAACSRDFSAWAFTPS